MQTLRQLVCGTDFSEDAEQALGLALRLALDAGAGLTLVHVCELELDDDAGRLAQCELALLRAVEHHARRGVAVTGVLRCGKPWEKLDNVATEVGASLIVIGRQGAGRGGRGGRQVELGSVAEHLVRCASRPVLTVACDFACSDDDETQPTEEGNQTP